MTCMYFDLRVIGVLTWGGALADVPNLLSKDLPDKRSLIFKSRYDGL